ncbi:hypothetical protein ANCCAN_17529 [Ancylostoma caninum]|uniref:Uncharacterized protein n=1 Tax=Ancylostoma caninum TaxID=29170 RepID=A0A368FYN6_ANCCA|nr:hypothetical protein ANCCAN_17529 [Ancylostoma caninum]
MELLCFSIVDPGNKDPKPVPAERPHDSGAHDHFHHVHDDAPFEPVGRGGVPLDQLIEDQVAEVHGDVDEVLHRMQETDEWKGQHVEKKEERKFPLTAVGHEQQRLINSAC